MTRTDVGHAVTYFTGISQNAGLTVIAGDYSLDGKITGYVMMDDTPTAGEITTFARGTVFVLNPRSRRSRASAGPNPSATTKS